MSLQGLTVHVPKRVDGDLSVQSAVISKLQALGATCVKRLTKDVTHVVFLRKLLPSAAEQAQQATALKDLYDRLIKIQPHAYVVSNLWVHSTAELGRKADEVSFIIPRPEEPPAPRFYGLGTDDSKGRKRSGVTPKRADASSIPLPVDAFSFDVDALLFSSSQQLHSTPQPSLAQRLAQRIKDSQHPPAGTGTGASPLTATRSHRKRRASAPLDAQPIKLSKRQTASTPGAAACVVKQPAAWPAVDLTGDTPAWPDTAALLPAQQQAPLPSPAATGAADTTHQQPISLLAPPVDHHPAVSPVLLTASLATNTLISPAASPLLHPSTAPTPCTASHVPVCEAAGDRKASLVTGPRSGPRVKQGVQWADLVVAGGATPALRPAPSTEHTTPAAAQQSVPVTPCLALLPALSPVGDTPQTMHTGDTCYMSAQEDFTTPGAGVRFSRRLRSRAGAGATPGQPAAQPSPSLQPAAAAAPDVSLDCTPVTLAVRTCDAPGSIWAHPPPRQDSQCAGDGPGGGTEADSYLLASPSLGDAQQQQQPAAAAVGCSTPTLILTEPAAVPVRPPAVHLSPHNQVGLVPSSSKGGGTVANEHLVGRAFNWNSKAAAAAVEMKPAHAARMFVVGVANAPRLSKATRSPRLASVPAAASSFLGAATAVDSGVRGQSAAGQEELSAGPQGVAVAARQLLAKRRRQGSGATLPGLAPAMKAPALLGGSACTSPAVLPSSAPPPHPHPVVTSVSSTPEPCPPTSVSGHACTQPVLPAVLHPAPNSPQLKHQAGLGDAECRAPDVIMCSPAEVQQQQEQQQQASEAAGGVEGSQAGLGSSGHVVVLDDGTMLMTGLEEEVAHVSIPGPPPAHHTVAASEAVAVELMGPGATQPNCAPGDQPASVAATGSGTGAERGPVASYEAGAVPAVKLAAGVVVAGVSQHQPATGVSQADAGRRYKQMRLCVPRLKGQQMGG